MTNDSTQCCAVVLSIIFPPLGVLLVDGCGCDLLINLLLTLLGFIPGIIHAMWVVFSKHGVDN